VWNEIPRHQSAADVLPEDSCRNTNVARKEYCLIDFPVRATFLIFDQLVLAFKCPIERAFGMEGTFASIEVIQQAVGLRGYAQRDPFIEYKLELCFLPTVIGAPIFWHCCNIKHNCIL